MRTANSASEPSTANELEITISGDRRSIESLYLELRDVARQHGAKIEYQLTGTKPPDSPVNAGKGEPQS